ncbi:phage baseplate assembly protein V [Halomonas sp. MMSF_3323]|uniref:phage baseplate assembly protein V n=1 Tax=Halomonas sp. MMSF_3323 TaxID=3046701 RepID=UPI00273DE8F7|nr:phage baseplate assembly protein V [Halomonas sp. MMSF_3323]
MNETWQLSDLRRRLANIVRPGVIDQLDTGNARVRVRAGEVLTGWLPWMTTRAMNDRSWWAPEPGEQVIVLSPSGELTNGYVLPAVFQQEAPPPASSKTTHAVEYADGTRVSHDRAASAYSVEVPAGGRITLKVGGSSLVIDDSGIRLSAPRIDLN